MSNPTGSLEAKGYLGGSVTFDGEFITIRRKGLNRLTIGKGEKRIHVGNISAVQIKPAGPVTNGFIAFTLAGGVEKQSRYGRQTRDAGTDENSVIFTRGQQKAFEELRTAVEAAIAALHRPAQSSGGGADELTKLAALRDSGALTQDEFENAKRAILNRM